MPAIILDLGAWLNAAKRGATLNGAWSSKAYAFDDSLTIA
jgi:hypothetical protein